MSSPPDCRNDSAVRRVLTKTAALHSLRRQLADDQALELRYAEVDDVADVRARLPLVRPNLVTPPGVSQCDARQRTTIGAAVELVDVGGRTMAYHRTGSGPPVVLLHGGWSDGRAWRPQLAGLAHSFDVIAWDAPGCGGSEDPPGGMTLADYADALAEMLAVLGVDRAHVGGLSWGGGLAIALYQHHPKLVRSLLLAGAYAGWKGSLPPEEVEARLRRVRAEAERPPAEWMGGYLPSFFSGPAPPEAIDLIQMMMSDLRAAGLLPMLTAFANADLREVLPTIAVPTLLLWGEADARAPIRPVAEALLASIPGSELVVLPGAGHYINLAAPDAFNAEVRRFLSAVS